MNKYLFLLLTVFSVSCAAPDEIDVSSDPDVVALDQLIDSITTPQDGYQLDKSVEIDGSMEKDRMPFSSATIQKDLKRLTDYSFSRLIKTTSYKKTSLQNGWQYDRRAKERKGPLLIRYQDEGISSQVVEITFEDKNLLYASANQVQLTLSDGRLTGYKIVGSRKLIGMNASDYKINVVIRGN